MKLCCRIILSLASLTIISLGDSQFETPEIDISFLFSTSDSLAKDNCISLIDKALQEHGVFLAKGYPYNHFSKAFSDAKKLFNVPSFIKTKYAVKNNIPFRGYLKFGAESGLDSYFEPKEGFSYGYPWENDFKSQNLLQNENVWPTDNIEPDLIHRMDNLYLHSSIIAQTIGKNLLQLLSNYTSEYSPSPSILEGGETFSLMRIFHYFSESSMSFIHSNKSVIGSSPHTDWGFLTVILQDETAGLQYQYKNQWIDIAPREDTLVINSGDYLSLISNGRYHSPVHRVLCPKDINRISFVYFFYPHYDTPFNNKKYTFEKDTSIEFNTLLSGDAEENVSPGDSDNDNATLKSIEMTFGSYIVKKWRDVFRH